MRSFYIRSVGRMLAAIATVALAACGSAASSASPVASGVAVSSPVQASPSAAAPVSPNAPAPASSAAWQRPLDVKTLPEAGIFKVVSETPSPGDKVPLFFMGAQG